MCTPLNSSTFLNGTSPFPSRTIYPRENQPTSYRPRFIPVYIYTYSRDEEISKRSLQRDELLEAGSSCGTTGDNDDGEEKEKKKEKEKKRSEREREKSHLEGCCANDGVKYRRDIRV